MVKAVMFDMGGTLEDIWVDAESERAAIERLQEMLREFGMDPKLEYEAFKKRIDDGWVEYGKYRDATNVELKPVEIWKNYVLKSFAFPDELLIPHCEEIAHMWEVTHFHRGLRPRVKEMLEELKQTGLRLGIISNTAALYQVFDSLEEYGIRDYFSDVTLSSVTGLRKPGTDIFVVSMRELQCSPEESVYVGDTVSRDIIGAKKAGYHTAIQICSKLTAEKDSEVQTEWKPDYFVKDIYEVAPIVKGLISA